MGPKFKVFLVGAFLIAAIAYAYYAFQNDPKRTFEIGREALRAGKLDDAKQAIQKLGEFPSYAAHRHFLRGSVMLREGAMDEAFQEFGYAIEHPDLEVDALVLSGQVLYLTRQAGNAKVLWDKALAIDPNCADAHRWLGVLCYDIGAMENALTEFGAVTKLAPNDPRPDRMMGMIHWMYDRPEDAVKHYRRSLSISADQPDLEDILLELAECEGNVRDYAAELETLKKCKTRTVRHRILEAEAHYSLGDSTQALKLLDEALQESPNEYQGHLWKGKILLSQEKPNEALKSFEEIADNKFADDEYHALISTCLKLLGRDEESQKHADEAAKFRDLWKRFHELHTKAIAEPANADLRYEIGQLASQLARPELAKSWYQAAMAINPNHAKAFEELSKIMKPDADPNSPGNSTSPLVPNQLKQVPTKSPSSSKGGS